MALTDVDYLKMAYDAARKSPDPSTQNGAVIPYEACGQLQVLTACNEFPEGVETTPERLQRPLKYNFIEHAERSVVYKAAKYGIALTGKTMYVPWFACSDCARAIIRSGVKRVVGHKRMLDATPPHWKESIAHAMTMLKEAGIQMDLIEEKLNIEPILFNGELWIP
jgi:dCMP deaminase